MGDAFSSPVIVIRSPGGSRKFDEILKVTMERAPATELSSVIRQSIQLGLALPVSTAPPVSDTREARRITNPRVPSASIFKNPPFVGAVGFSSRKVTTESTRFERGSQIRMMMDPSPSGPRITNSADLSQNFPEDAPPSGTTVLDSGVIAVGGMPETVMTDPLSSNSEGRSVIVIRF